MNCWRPRSFRLVMMGQETKSSMRCYLSRSCSLLVLPALQAFGLSRWGPSRQSLRNSQQLLCSLQLCSLTPMAVALASMGYQALLAQLLMIIVYIQFLLRPTKAAEVQLLTLPSPHWDSLPLWCSVTAVPVQLSSRSSCHHLLVLQAHSRGCPHVRSLILFRWDSELTG